MMNISYPYKIFLALLTLLVLSLACNLPAGNSAFQEAISEMEAAVAETGSLTLRSANIEGGQVTITVDLSAGQTQTGLISSWVYLFEVATQQAPNADRVVLKLYTMEEPYATLTAQSADIQALVDEHIDLLTFFSRVQMDDQRPPEDALRQSLASAGWIVTNVSISPQRVDIEGFPPPRPTRDGLIMDWFRAMEDAAVYAPDSQQVYLHLLLTDPSGITLMVNMADIRAYQAGNLDPGIFLASLTIME